MPLVINSLGRRHTHTHTHTQAHIPTIRTGCGRHAPGLKIKYACGKGGGTGLAGPVLAEPLFQEVSKYLSANPKSNIWLRIGLEYEFWNTL